MEIIYIYTTESYKEKCWYKIGMTTQETADVRISQQDSTSNPEKLIKLYELNLQKEGYNITAYELERKIHDKLKKSGKHIRKEWFELKNGIDEVKELIEQILDNTEIHKKDIVLKPHQIDAINKIIECHNSNDKKILLFHKPRSGKTFVTLKYIADNQFKNVVIITSYPILNYQWEEEIDRLKGFSNYKLINVSGSGIKKIELSDKNNIVLLSVQDVKGGEEVFEKEKFDLIKDINWDLLVIDEVHYGIETQKTNEFLDKIKYKRLIGLSATPSKNLICGRFNKDQIHTYTLVEENKLKKENPELYPYADINFLLWSLTSEEKNSLSIFSDEEQFTMKKLFRIEDDEFYYKADIVYLFKKLIGSKDICKECQLGTMYPFKNYAKYSSIKTILLFVPSIKVQEKLVSLLNEINEYKEDFDIHITNSNLYSSNKLIKAIKREFKSNNKRSLIIAVDQLTTGITLEDCDMVAFMNDWESVDKWIQASFRSQSPRIGKKQCYVLDMNPARTFEMIYSYNNCINIFGNKSMEQSMNEWFECVNVFNRVDGDFVKVDVQKFNEEYIKILTEKPRFNYQSVIFSDKLQLVKDKLLNIGITTSKSSVKEKLSPDGLEKGKNKNKIPVKKEILNKELDISKLMDIAKALVDKTMLLSIFTYFKHDKVDECINILENDNTIIEGIGELERDMFLDTLLLGMENVNNIKLSDIKYIYDTIYDKEIINKKIHIFNQKVKKLIELINNGDTSMLKNYIELINDYLMPSNTEKRLLAEVFTPLDGPGGVREQLSLLEDEWWSNPNRKILDCSAGIGNYPVIVIEKLMKGLSNWEPNEEKRLKHILENMLYMVELQPKNVFILLMIFNPENKYKLNIYRGDYLKFDPVKEFGIEKFDLICSNPPYQIIDGRGGKGSSAKPIYNLFIEKSINISEKVIMITPSRWFVGGKGLDNFRKMMLNRSDIKYINHIEGNGSEVFGKNVDIPGGVSYFLIDKKYKGNLILNGKEIDKSKLDILLTDPIHYQIIEKIKNKHKGDYLNKIVESRNYYGKIINGKKTLSNASECVNEKIDDNYLKCYVSKTEGFVKYVHKKFVRDVKIDNYKVFTTKAYGIPYKMGNTFKGKPNEICTETYLVINCENEIICDNLLSYLKCSLIKYLFALLKNTQNISKETFSLIPLLDMTKKWSDVELYEYFNINETEIKFIENII